MRYRKNTGRLKYLVARENALRRFSHGSENGGDLNVLKDNRSAESIRCVKPE